MKFGSLGNCLLVALWLGAPGAAGATQLFSVQDNAATLGGVLFDDGDIVSYDAIPDTATLLFDEANFANNEDVDAFHQLDNGNFLLSTRDSGSLGGLTFRNGDIVEWDPVAQTASLFFDEDLFSGNENIDALSVLANGNLVLSTDAGATLGGLSFGNGDLIEYDPVADIATLLLAQSAFTGSANIDAVHVLANGSIRLSTVGNATLGGLDFRDGDIVEYDPVADTAVLVFSEDSFSGNEDVDAYSIVPEPGSGSLLGLGLVGLVLGRRSRRTASR